MILLVLDFVRGVVRLLLTRSVLLKLLQWLEVVTRESPKS